MIEIAFVLRNVPGTVTVEYSENEDPRAWGYQLLNLRYDIDAARGCPVINATVEYSAAGYAAQLGWIQVITADGDKFVDLAPQLLGTGIPWYSWGHRPTLFDAPSSPAPDRSFRADAFLAYTPEALMSRVVAPLCGFSWGYDQRDHKPTMLPLEISGLRCWPAAREVLHEHCPGWTFHEAA